MLRIGLVGAGFIGKSHAEGMTNTAGVKLVGITVHNDYANRDKLCAQYGCKAYDSYEDMLNSTEIDVIDICVPSHLHEEFAIRAARAKKHILLEKPIAMNLDGATKIVEAAEQNNVRLMVGQTMRFWPEYVKIKELYDRGVLGEVKSVYAARLGQEPNWDNGWYKDPAKSGELMLNLTLHDIDFLHYLLGAAESVYTVGAKDVHGGYNDVKNIFRFKNGSFAMVDGSLTMTPGYPFTMTCRLDGTKATLEFVFKAGVNLDAGAKTTLTLYREGEKPAEVEYETYDPFQNEIAYFADCMNNNRPFDKMTNESVLGVMRSIDAAKLSLRDNQVKWI